MKPPKKETLARFYAGKRSSRGIENLIRQDAKSRSKCVKTKLFNRPIILCFEGEEIPMNKPAKRFLKAKAWKVSK